MSSNGDPTESTLAQLARGLLDDDTAERFDDELGALLDGVTGTEVDLAGLSGLVTGARRSEIIEQLSQHKRPSPPVRTSDIEDDEGNVVGVQVFVAEPPSMVKVWRGPSEIMIVTSTSTVDEVMPFTPGRVEWVENESIAEFVVWPEEPVSGALPDGEDDPGDTDDSED